MTKWFYSKSGQQLGPISQEEFTAKCASGEILQTDLVWNESMPDWKPLSQVPMPVSPPKVMPAPLPEPLVNPEQQMTGSVLKQQPPAVDISAFPQVIPTYMWQSVTALVLSAFQMFFFCLPIGLAFAIVAVIYANKVDTLRAMQDYIAANNASRNAKIWMIASFSVTGLVLLCILGIMILAFSSMP